MNADFRQVILYVQQVEKLKTFYQAQLGFEVVQEIEDDWVLLRGGSTQLGLHRVGEQYRNPEAKISQAANNVKLVFRISEDVAEVRQRLIDAGVEMGEVKQYPAVAAKLCDGTDPEGNAFQLSQPHEAA